MRTTKNLLLTTASAVALAAFSSGAGAQTLVGTASTNSVTATAAGDVFAFDVNNGTLTNTGTITSTGAVAVVSTGTNFGNIVNSGAITSDADDAIGLNNGGTVTNNTGGVITADLIAIAIASNANTSTVTNSGTIASTGGDNAIVLGGRTNLTNNSAGVITASTSSTVNIASNAASSSIVNNGTITNTGVASGDAIVLADNIGAISTLNNTGTIISASGVGVNVGEGASVTNGITNSGVIRSNGVAGTAIQIGSNVGASSTDITNTGSIISSGVGIRVLNGSAVGTITNSGTINGTTQSILVADSAPVTVTNTGTIIGNVLLGGGADTFNMNGGSISSTLNLAGGADTLNITSGVITGTVGVAGGEDTVIISGGTVSGAALDLGTENDNLTISGGAVSSDITLGSGDDVFNITGGVITGTINGNLGTDALNISGDISLASSVAISAVEDININSGSVSFASTVAGATTFDIAAGASLNQSADIAATTFTNAGTLTLTASQTITGDYTQSSAGSLDLDYGLDGAAEVLTVTGNATFDSGAVLNINSTGISLASAIADGNYDAVQTGGLTATDVSNLTIASANPLIQFEKQLNGNDVRLTATGANTAQIGDNVLNGNGITGGTAQLATLAGGGQAGTNAVNTLGSYSTLLTALNDSDATEFNRINNALNGLDAAGTAQALEDLSGDAGVVSANSFAVSASINASNQVIVAQLSDARTQMAAAPEGAAAGGKFGSDLRVWVQPFAGTFEQDRKQGVEGYESNTFGLAFGGDVSLSETMRGGIAFSYANTDVDGEGTNAANGSEINGYNLSLYGTFTPMDNLFIDAMVGYGYNDYETNRFVSFLGQRAKADYDGNQFNFRLGAGYDIKADALIVTPSTYVTYSRIEQDSYTETDAGGASLAVQDQEVDRGQVGLDLTIAYPMQIEQGLLKPRFSVGYAHEIGDENVSSTQSFAGGGAAFTTRGADLDENVGKFGLGVDLEADNGTVFTLQGEYENRSSADGFSGFARVKAPF